ncbi:hypothetical protein F0L68_14065 [Solihabitans fulvus]|uniref:Tetratricopeptide repeat protein n=1 Tax=Solihabitans fulvus TaxID=1892852 RepID=A0A5B2XH72_9PSEU|nr:ATP-binding protein [Solihabitans fulvus]KAA2262385.1 hypothetical protein F0L68_14065 [Solihabitans fulvus]
MGERRALVVGSQCEQPNLLSSLPDTAWDVADTLLDEDRGACVPALAGTPVLLNPTTVELNNALDTAFERASADQATLLLAVLGHGEYGTGDPRVPPSEFHLANRISELLTTHHDLDGLVLLLDTCRRHAGDSPETEWITALGRAGRRFELLAAANEGPGTDGCLTRTVASTLRSGSPTLGGYLRLPDLRAVVARACDRSATVHLSFDGRRTVVTGDEGLWLARNPASCWQGSPFAGTGVADTAERLTRHYTPTDTVDAVVAAALGRAPCVAIHGPAGSGKSTVLAALIHPAIASDSVPAAFLHAVAWQADRRTPGQVAAELADHLTTTVPGFAAAREAFTATTDAGTLARADEFDRSLLGPLNRIDSPIRTIRVAVDLDGRLPPRLGDALRRLVELPLRVQVLLTTRDERGLPTGTVPVPIRPPDEPTIAGYLRAAGVASPLPATAPAWGAVTTAVAAATTGHHQQQPVTLNVIVGDVHGTVVQAGAIDGPVSIGDPTRTLLSNILNTPSTQDSRDLRTVLTVLAAAHDCSALPVRLLAHAASRLGAHRPIRDLLTQLGGLLLRGQPGTDAERVGLRDQATADALAAADPPTAASPVTASEIEAHQAIAEAIAALAPATEADRTGVEHEYAEVAEAEHLWRAGRFADALRAVDLRSSPVPVANREAWAAWRRRSAAELGPTHRLTLLAGARHGMWLAKSGDPHGALRVLEPLLGNTIRHLGSTDPDTLALRHNLAYWSAETGHPDRARDEFQQLARIHAELNGPDHEHTLDVRLQAAISAAKTGDVTWARGQFDELIPISERALGATHWVTISLLDNALFWGEETSPATTTTQHRIDRLAEAGRAIAGRDSDKSIGWRLHAAIYRAKYGHPAEAVTEFRALRHESIAIFGLDHAWTTRIAEQLAFWTTE